MCQPRYLLKNDIQMNLSRLVAFDPKTNKGIISHGQGQILVDTNLLGVMDSHSSKSLHQFLGEINECEVSILKYMHIMLLFNYHYYCSIVYDS